MEMFLNMNILETTTMISFGGILMCLLLHFITNISPITGIWFPLYIITIFIVSSSTSIKTIQWLLHLNKPVKYDLDRILKDFPCLSFLSSVLPHARKTATTEYKEYDTNELSVISSVLERKLVSSWYVPYISLDIGFPFACKQMLDQMIGKSFQICNKIETKDVYVDISTIMISHLKEYKKALKRHEKSSSSTIESVYKKSHPVFNDTAKKQQPADHCTNILRVIFKELVPWELWDTPHSELLIRVLSKKLDTFIDSTIADPAWLNNKLLTILKGKSEPKIVEEPVLLDDKIHDAKPETTTTGTVFSGVTVKSATPVLQSSINEEAQMKTVPEMIEEIVEEVPVTSSEPMDIKSSPVLRQKRGRQGRNEVKIYDRIIEGSIKTWETDVDLQCISMGQDLLASLDGEITLSRLWGQDADPEGSPNPPRRKSPQPLWFGEEDAIDIDPLDISPPREPKKESSPKPTDALLKDLQSTVSQAKTKIGDLQVEPNVALHVTRKQNSSDEAAGMMEGLLDFGIAGLKKGLRFTGLSDDSQDKSPSHLPHKASDQTPPPEVSRPKAIVEHKEIPITAVIQKEDTPSVPPLLKQNRVISQDSVPSQAKSAKAPAGPLGDSPEPEYEEAADLSTSIAKLRCLLQQRADSSPRAEEVWWESAEETRGRTQHHHSSRPVDTATLADEYDMNMDRNTSPGQTSNNMQRLDKLFQRTVTGVFNSLKTAVGAEGDEPPPRDHHWTYVTTSIDLSVWSAVSRVVGGRRAAAPVEAALDSLRQLPAPRARSHPEPDDFDEWCSVNGCAWCSCCDVASAAGLCRPHVVLRCVTVVFADLVEPLIEEWLEEVSAWLRRQVFVVFEQMAERRDADGPQPAERRDADSSKATERRDADGSQPTTSLPPLQLDDTCAAVMEKIQMLAFVFGADTAADAVKLVLSSFTHKEVNRDVIFRILDILAVHFKKSAELRNPSFDST